MSEGVSEGMYEGAGVGVEEVGQRGVKWRVETM